MKLKTNDSYAIYKNYQVYKDGRFYDLREEKYINTKGDSLVFKDFSQMKNYGKASLPYRRTTRFKKNVMWECFYGTIPKTYKVDYINKDLTGNMREALSNLKLVKRCPAKVKKKHKEVKKRVRDKMFKKIMVLVDKDYSKEEIIKELKTTENQIRKILRENKLDMTYVFKFDKFKQYVAKKVFQGEYLTVIAQRKGVSLELIYEALKIGYGIEEPKRFEKKYRFTMELMYKNGDSVQEIQNKILSDYRKRVKKNE